MADSSRQKATLVKLNQAYHATFDREEGQTVLHDLMRRGHVLDPIDTNDPIELARMEGHRAAVIHILTMLRMTLADVERIFRQPIEEDPYG